MARMNALGLLQISCASAAPGIQKSWPLESNIREHVQGAAGTPEVRQVRIASVNQVDAIGSTPQTRVTTPQKVSN
jgi:hypothetical protein